MHLIWSTINTLQLLTHLPLFHIQLPSNALFFFYLVIDISNFEFLPTKMLNDALLKFKQVKEAFSVQFKMVGYESFNFIENLGLVFFILMGVLIGMLIVYITKYFLAKLCIRIYTFIKRKIFFDAIIRLILEGYLEISLGAIVNAHKLDFSLSGESFASVLSMLFVIIVCLFPAVTFVFLQKNYKRLP